MYASLTVCFVIAIAESEAGEAKIETGVLEEAAFGKAEKARGEVAQKRSQKELRQKSHENQMIVPIGKLLNKELLF